MQALHVALAQVKALFGEDHDTAAFRGFIRQRGQLRRVGQRFLLDARRGQKFGRLTVA
ncbi:hypothetical protein D3C75_1261880 [compost metagenome]